MRVTRDWLPGTTPLTVAITSGASCPDALVDEVILKICGYFNETVPVDEAMEGF